jgi:hypothetical protein
MYNAITLVPKKLCDGTVLEAGSKILLYQRTPKRYHYYCSETSTTEFKPEEFEYYKNANVDESTVEGFKNFLNVEMFGYNAESKTWPIAEFEYSSGAGCHKHFFDCELSEDEKTFIAKDITKNIVNDDLLDFDPVYHSEPPVFDRDKFSAVKVHVTDTGDKVFTIFGFDHHSNKLLKFLMEQVIAHQTNEDTKDSNSAHDIAFASSILESDLVKAPVA